MGSCMYVYELNDFFWDGNTTQVEVLTPRIKGTTESGSKRGGLQLGLKENL